MYSPLEGDSHTLDELVEAHQARLDILHTGHRGEGDIGPLVPLPEHTQPEVDLVVKRGAGRKGLVRMKLALPALALYTN